MRCDRNKNKQCIVSFSENKLRLFDRQLLNRTDGIVDANNLRKCALGSAMLCLTTRVGSGAIASLFRSFVIQRWTGDKMSFGDFERLIYNDDSNSERALGLSVHFYMSKTSCSQDGCEPPNSNAMRPRLSPGLLAQQSPPVPQGWICSCGKYFNNPTVVGKTDCER